MQLKIEGKTQEEASEIIMVIGGIRALSDIMHPMVNSLVTLKKRFHELTGQEFEVAMREAAKNVEAKKE